MQITITNEQLATILGQTKIKLKDKASETLEVLAKYETSDEFTVEEFWLKTIETVGFRHYHQVNVFLQDLEKQSKVIRCSTKSKSRITGNKIILYKKV